MSSGECEWCVKTTESIDGLEYALEISEKELKLAREIIQRHRNAYGTEADPTKHIREQNHALCEAGIELGKQLEQANLKIAQLESPWISIEDMLPEMFEAVLISDRKNIGHARLTGRGWSIVASNDMVPDSDVTHWRNLPDGPK